MLDGESPYPWQDDAACINVDPDMFFPKVGDLKTPQEAREICTTCPVAAQCLELGMSYEFGMFGGMTPRQRSALKNGTTRYAGTREKQLAMHRRRMPVEEIARQCGVSERTVFRTIAKYAS